jgi:magnesium transporter
MIQENDLSKINELLYQNNHLAIFAFLESFQPVDLAQLIEQLEPSNQYRIVSILPIEQIASTIEYMTPVEQYHLFAHMEEEKASNILNQMSSDEVADMMLALHRHQTFRLLNLLQTDYREKVETLMTFPEFTAGSLATANYISARMNWNTEQTLTHIRKVGREAEITSYVYVTGHKGELIGVVSLKEIILAEPQHKLADIVTAEPITVSAYLPQEQAAEILSKYDFIALPVVDDHQRLIGVIAVDDMIDVITEEATEDIQKLGGSEPLTEPYFKTSVFQLYRKRIIWLLVLFVAEAYTGFVLRNYEDVLTQVIYLSFFIPLLIGTGGNTGTQIVTTLVRALAVGEVKFKDIFKVMRKELFTGLIIGLTLSAVAFAKAQILGVPMEIGITVGLTAMAIVMWASLVAGVLPLILHICKVDPAVVSGPLIATLVDGTGLILYFTIAKIALNL